MLFLFLGVLQVSKFKFNFDHPTLKLFVYTMPNVDFEKKVFCQLQMQLTQVLARCH